MQPDDPSITPVSTAATAAAFSIFLVLLVLIASAFLLVGTTVAANYRRQADAIHFFWANVEYCANQTNFSREQKGLENWGWTWMVFQRAAG
jgi:hypothetical protein